MSPLHDVLCSSEMSSQIAIAPLILKIVVNNTLFNKVYENDVNKVYKNR